MKVFGLLLVVVLLAAALPLQAKAEGEPPQTLNVAEWTGPTNTGITGRETVLKVGDTYHMWYSSSNEKTLYHTYSDNPASFSAATSACTFTDGTPFEVGSVSVVKEGDYFYMIAYGADNQEFAIYTSADGTAWTYGGVVFDGEGLPEYNKIDGAFLFKDGETYRLYFQVKTPATNPTIYSIYLAEAEGTLASIADGNDDVDFTLNSTSPVLSPSGTGWDAEQVMHPWVVKDGSNYYMWYSGWGTGFNQQVGMAKSTNGVNWVKSPANPIFAPATGYAEPSVIVNADGTWEMWTMGTGGVINYLTATGPFEFQSIQAAVNAAVAGDTINVAPGEYVEVGQIVIDKNLTIVGADKATTIIKPAQNTGASADARGWWLVNVGVQFNLSNVTLDGAGKLVSIGILSHGTGTIENNIIKNISYNPSGPDYAGRGIAIYDADMTIKNNLLQNIGRIGIYVYGADADQVVIDGNTYEGKGIGDWLDYGIEIEGGAKAEVKNNLIKNCTGIASVDGSGSAGLLITTYFASGSTANIHHNEFNGNSVGINVGYDSTDTSSVVAEKNQLLNNVTAIVTTAPAVDALLNWWGNWYGPSAGKIDAEDATIGPWCADIGCATFLPDAKGEIHVPAGQTLTADILQTLIDNAPEGTKIFVPAATYTRTGGYQINKPHLTIILTDGTVIQNDSPCFVINASFTKIYAQPGAKCIPVGGANGIDVAAGLTDIRIEGLEIDGTGQTTGDGIHFAGIVTDLTLLDNNIHDLDGDGVEFTGQPGGTVIIRGNAFTNNTAKDVNAGSSVVDATRNYWGVATGPATSEITIGVAFAPWCADQGCSLYATNVAALDPTDSYGVHEGKVYAGYKMMDGEEQIPLTAANLYSFWVLAPGETEFTELVVGDDTDPNLWFNVEKGGGLYEYVARAKNGLTYASTLNWTEASEAEFAATGGFGEHEGVWYTEFQMLDGDDTPISLAEGAVELIATKDAEGNWVELEPNTDATLWFNIAHATGEYEFLVVTEGTAPNPDIVYTATLDWNAKVDATLEPIDSYGIHDGKVYAGYELMDGETQIPLIESNIAGFWALAPGETEYVELVVEGETDPYLWFNVEKLTGTYAYTVVTTEGQVYQASIDWTAASTAAFEATGGFGEHEGVWYTEFQMKDAEGNPISLAIDDVDFIAEKLPAGTEWIPLEANTDETLWFNIANLTGEYEFLVVTKDDVVYTATLDWKAKVDATFESTETFGIHDGKVYAGYMMMAGDVQVRLDNVNLASFWSQAPEQAPVQLILDEDPLLWFNVEKPAGIYAYTAITKTGQVYQASIDWTAASTATFGATGGFGEHDGVLYKEFQMLDGTLPISLAEGAVELIATKDADGNWVALEPNTDETLWFNIAHATGNYEFLVVTSDDVVYKATLGWTAPTAATLESTETFGIHLGKVYAGYMMMAGEPAEQIQLTDANLASFWSKAPGGVPVSLTLDEDPLLWFNVEKAAGTYEYTAVTETGQIYQASLTWTAASAAAFNSTGRFGEHLGVIYQEFEMLDGTTPISLAEGAVKLIAQKVGTDWVELTPNTDVNLWFNVELAAKSYEFLVVTSEDVVYKATLAWPGPNEGEFTATGQFVVDDEDKTSIEFQLLDAEGNPISLASDDLKLIAQKDENEMWVPFTPGTDETLWFDEDIPDGSYEFLVVTSDEVVYTATLVWTAPKDATLDSIDSYGVHVGKVYAGYQLMDGTTQIPLIESNIASFWVKSPGATEYVELVVEGEDDPYLWFNVEKGYGTYLYKAITTAGVMYDAQIVWTPPMVANFAATGGFGEHDGVLYKEFQMLDGTLPISLAEGAVELIATKDAEGNWVELTPNTDTNLWFNIAKPTGNYYFLVVTEDGRIYKATLEWVAPTAATLESTETFGIHEGKVYAGYKMMAGGVQVPLDMTNLASFWSKAPGQDPVQLTLDEDPLLWFNVEKDPGTYEYTAVTKTDQIYQASLTWTEASAAAFEATGRFGEHEGATYKEFKMVDSEGNPISLAIGAVKLIAEKGPEEDDWVALEPNTDETLWFNIANDTGEYKFLVVTSESVVYEAILEWNEPHAPIAKDMSVTTTEDTSKVITLDASDEDDDPLSAIIVTPPVHGTVTVNGLDATYTPAANYNGTDSFTFKANDGLLDSNIATVTITITAVNDAPVAEDIEAETDEDTPVAITLVASDVDGDGLTFTFVTQPAHGTLSGTAPALTYTPAADFNGTDSFTYKANDGTVDSNIATVSITIAAVNDAPVAEDIEAETPEDTPVEIELVASDVEGDELTFTVVTQPAHGTLSGTAPELTYTPAANYNGEDSFTFKANDDALDSNIATVTITVGAVNDGPIAVDDEYEILMGEVLEVNAIDGVLANDFDPDPSDEQTVEVKDAPLHGELVLNADGSFTYEPDAGFHGIDTFTYWLISEPGVQSAYMDSATVTITVRPVARIFLPIILK